MNAGQRTRATLAKRDGWGCCYCGRITVEKDRDDDDRATIEHVLPQSRGGTDALDNLRIACRRCNWLRGNGEAAAPDPAWAVPCPRCCVPAGRACISVVNTRTRRLVHAARLRTLHGR